MVAVPTTALALMRHPEFATRDLSSIRMILCGAAPDLRASLAAYKIPKHVEFPAAFPRTTSGKALRRTLNERMIQSPDV